MPRESTGPCLCGDPECRRCFPGAARRKSRSRIVAAAMNRRTQEQQAFCRDQARQRAVKAMTHYLRSAQEASGRPWTSDNQAEAAQLVDDIIEAAGGHPNDADGER